MRSAPQLVQTLLEDEEDDYDPKALLATSAGNDWKISTFPPELHKYLKAGNEFGPSEKFLKAMAMPTYLEQRWQFNDPADLPIWPENDSESEWTRTIHFCFLAVRNSELWVQHVKESPSGQFFQREALWGSPEHQRLRQNLGRRAYVKAWVAFYRDSAASDKNPEGRVDAYSKLRRWEAKLDDRNLDDPSKPVFVIP